MIDEIETAAATAAQEAADGPYAYPRLDLSAPNPAAHELTAAREEIAALEPDSANCIDRSDVLTILRQHTDALVFPTAEEAAGAR